AGALHFVFIPALREIELNAGSGPASNGACELGLHVDEAEDHAPKVCEIADGAAALKRAQKSDYPEDHHHVLGFDRKQEAHQHGLIGEEHAEREQQSVDRARCANRRLILIPGEHVDDDHADARADAADEVILQEALRAPGFLNGGSEHPQREHVEEDMRKAAQAVQKQISNKLPDGEMHHHRRNQLERYKRSVADRARPEEVDQIDDDVRNDEPFYAGWKRPVEERGAGAEPRVVSHEKSPALIDRITGGREFAAARRTRGYTQLQTLAVTRFGRGVSARFPSG